MKLVIITTILLSLTGCVGVTLTDFDTKEYQANETNIPKYIMPISNGTIKIPKGKAWCGIVLYVVIPIPLILPTCNNSTEITYSNNLPVTVTYNKVTNPSYMCGPFMWVAQGLVHGYKGNFICGKIPK